MTQTMIVRTLIGISRDAFMELVPHILKAASGLTPVKVDGTNDGGVDFCLYEGIDKKKFVVQTTDTWQRLENKLLADAKKLSEREGVELCYAMVKNVVSYVKKETIENKALKTYGVMMKVFGANELASFVSAYNLEDVLLRLAGKDLDNSDRESVSQTEVWLHSYVLMSQDCKDLREEMIDSALSLNLYRAGTAQKEDLVNRCCSMLKIPQGLSSRVEGRIDSLLVKGRVVRLGGMLELAQTTREEIDLSVRLYHKGLQQFAETCASVAEKYGARKFDVDPKRLATLLAKCYLKYYVQVLKESGFEMNSDLFRPIIPDPAITLKDMLRYWVNPEFVDVLYDELVRTAGGIRFVKSIVESVMYVALREETTGSAPVIFDADSWHRVVCYVDSSVAMPYLVSKLCEGHCDGIRTVRPSLSAVEKLFELDATAVIHPSHLAECAAHLIEALRFCELETMFASDLEYARNAYVSYYFRIKRSCGADVPDSLRTLSSFLFAIAPSLSAQNVNSVAYWHNVLSDVREKFSIYGLWEREYTMPKEEVDEEYRTRLFEAFRDTSKTSIRLQRNDVKVLMEMSYRTAHDPSRFVLLSWDRTIAGLESSLRKNFWVVSPINMLDLLNIYSRTTDEELLSMSHEIAMVSQNRELGFVKVLEKIAEITRGKHMDIECLDEIRRLRENYFNSQTADCGGDINGCIEKATRILERHGMVGAGDEDGYASGDTSDAEL